MTRSNKFRPRALPATVIHRSETGRTKRNLPTLEHKGTLPTYRYNILSRVHSITQQQHTERKNKTRKNKLSSQSLFRKRSRSRFFISHLIPLRISLVLSMPLPYVKPQPGPIVQMRRTEFLPQRVSFTSEQRYTECTMILSTLQIQVNELC